VADSVADSAEIPLTWVAAAGAVATVAFWAYTRTLLPGVDLGDTGGFQAAAIWWETSARESYPLYYTLGQGFIAAFSAANPARGLNLFSAVWAGVAAGLLTFVTARIARSALAGAAGGLMLAFSYTFWTQAIIAEVYTLHLALIAACLLALAAYQQRPTTVRLAAFFAVYAVSFGNHYGMILLLLPFTVFLLMVHPRPREIFRPRIIGLALVIAAAAALQYAGNFLEVWASVEASRSVPERLAAFWFETTKADWRETMVLGAGGAGAKARVDRLAMLVWDARQQFGAAGLVLGVAGAIRLWRIDRAWATLILLAYLISAAFAATYNVGDVHVFFLPAHFFTAMAIAMAIGPIRVRGGPIGRPRLHAALALAVVAYAGWRGWDTWPAVDRHADRRAEQLVSRVAQGVSDRDAILVSDLDWESENALLYASRHDRLDLAWARLGDVLLHLPFLVADNHELGRDLVLTGSAAADITAAYGDYFPIVPEAAVPAPSLIQIAADLPRGTPYVLALLPPAGRRALDPADVDALLAALSGRRPAPRQDVRYEVWSGLTGDRPSFYRGGLRPFRDAFSLLGDPFLVRMESWLPDDTFRRAGFGRVLRGRQPVLTVERGLSLAWFRPDGSPAVAYGAGLYALQPRFRIPAQAERFALCSKSCGSSLPW
jgi:hypothetical protein